MKFFAAVIGGALVMTLPLFTDCAHGQEQEKEKVERPKIVLDNNDKEFMTEGDGWNFSTRDLGYYGKDYLWHAQGKGEAKAIWKTALPKRGFYNVYARWVMSKPSDRATNALFTIYSMDPPIDVRVNMAARQSAAEYPAGTVQSSWNLLGRFAFDRGGTVVLSNDADNAVVADAIVFEYMEPVTRQDIRVGKILFKDECDNMDNWFVEGKGTGEIVNGKLLLKSNHNVKGVHAWFKKDLPDNVIIQYDMTIHGKKGFAMAYLAAHNPQGKDILTDLSPRDGTFDQYVQNPEMCSYHFSIHRVGVKSWVDGANLHKNPGKRFIQRNAVDPCPPADGDQTYHVVVMKIGPAVRLLVNNNYVLFYLDDDEPFYTTGKFGFRQVYESAISYDNFTVHTAVLPPRPK